MKHLKLKIKEYLDQRQCVLHYEDERKVASEKLYDMCYKEIQRELKRNVKSLTK